MTLLFRIMTVLIAGAIIYLSLIPGDHAPDFQWPDKINHFMAYGALTGSLGLGWRKLPLWAVMGLAMTFGIGLEILQGLGDAGRTASWLDAVANGLGVISAAIALTIIRRSPRILNLLG